jgi:hypothetical protein
MNKRMLSIKTGNKTLAACCACRFLRHPVPQKPRFTTALRTGGSLAVWEIKNRLIGDFF